MVFVGEDVEGKQRQKRLVDRQRHGVAHLREDALQGRSVELDHGEAEDEGRDQGRGDAHYRRYLQDEVRGEGLHAGGGVHRPPDDVREDRVRHAERESPGEQGRGVCDAHRSQEQPPRARPRLRNRGGHEPEHDERDEEPDELSECDAEAVERPDDAVRRYASDDDADADGQEQPRDDADLHSAF